MLSGKLIHLIEVHHREIGDHILREIARDPELIHLSRLSEAELRERGQIIIENLSSWLASERHEIVKKQEDIGKLRFQQSIPLHEVVKGLLLVKRKMLDYLEEHGIPKDSLNLYAEEEFERRIGGFFDTLVVHTVRGYEAAWHHAMELSSVAV